MEWFSIGVSVATLGVIVAILAMVWTRSGARDNDIHQKLLDDEQASAVRRKPDVR